MAEGTRTLSGKKNHAEGQTGHRVNQRPGGSWSMASFSSLFFLSLSLSLFHSISLPFSQAYGRDMLRLMRRNQRTQRRTHTFFVTNIHLVHVRTRWRRNQQFSSPPSLSPSLTRSLSFSFPFLSLSLTVCIWLTNLQQVHVVLDEEEPTTLLLIYIIVDVWGQRGYHDFVVIQGLDYFQFVLKCNQSNANNAVKKRRRRKANKRKERKKRKQTRAQGMSRLRCSSRSWLFSICCRIQSVKRQ